MKYIFKTPTQPTFDRVGVKGYIFNTSDTSEKTQFLIIDTIKGHTTTIIEQDCDFSYYILEGSGCFLINDIEHQVNKGDLVVLPNGTKFTYKGKLKMLLNCTPPYTPEQEITVD